MSGELRQGQVRFDSQRSAFSCQLSGRASGGKGSGDFPDVGADGGETEPPRLVPESSRGGAVLIKRCNRAQISNEPYFVFTPAASSSDLVSAASEVPTRRAYQHPFEPVKVLLMPSMTLLISSPQ